MKSRGRQCNRLVTKVARNSENLLLLRERLQIYLYERVNPRCNANQFAPSRALTPFVKAIGGQVKDHIFVGRNLDSVIVNLLIK
jgi:hypothetical protein